MSVNCTLKTDWFYVYEFYFNNKSIEKRKVENPHLFGN